MGKLIHRTSTKEEVEIAREELENVIKMVIANKVSARYVRSDFENYPEYVKETVIVPFYNDMAKNEIDLEIKYSLRKTKDDFDIDIKLLDIILTTYKIRGLGLKMKRFKKNSKRLKKMRVNDISIIREISKTILAEDYYIYTIANYINQKISSKLKLIKE